MRSFIGAILLSGLAFAASPAAADSVKFYQGNTGYTGGPSFTSGAGSVYALTQGSTTNCPTIGSCTTDNVASSLIFNVTGNVITATATYNGAASSVWGDFAPNFGGLGVGTDAGTLYHNTDDQINGYEVLHIHFQTAVSLTGIGTLFDNGHTTFGTNGLFATGSSITNTNTFLYSTNGSSFSSLTFANANSNSLSTAFSNDFYFKEAGCSGAAPSETCTQPEFYVSALTYHAVPGPVVGAGLPGLVVACGGLLGWWRRRSRPTPA